MKFSGYLTKRKKVSLTRIECKVFGIECTKGWKKRYADLIITDEMMTEIGEHLVNSEAKTPAEKRLQARVYDYKKKSIVCDKKLLYLMKNTRGEMKIGISIDPIKRARQLTTGSGTQTVCLAAWEVEGEAYDVEQYLLKAFKDSRTEGEWFKARAFNTQDIENKINQGFKRVYEAKETYYKKGNVDTEQYEYLHIKHETAKALLFNILGHSIWIAKSMIKAHNKEQHLITVPIGTISEKLACV